MSKPTDFISDINHRFCFNKDPELNFNEWNSVYKNIISLRHEIDLLKQASRNAVTEKAFSIDQIDLVDPAKEKSEPKKYITKAEAIKRMVDGKLARDPTGYLWGFVDGASFHVVMLEDGRQCFEAYDINDEPIDGWEEAREFIKYSFDIYLNEEPKPDAHSRSLEAFVFGHNRAWSDYKTKDIEKKYRVTVEECHDADE